MSEATAVAPTAAPAGAPATGPITVPLDDVQAGVFDPTIIDFERHLFLQVLDAAGGRAFLRSLIPHVTTEAQAVGVRGAGSTRPASRTSIGFTAEGLAAIGVDHNTLGSFPTEFREGNGRPSPEPR